MRNKLIAIVAASVLPLGLAVSASATDPSAQHEVTFTVADARSISVAVSGGQGADNTVLDFGSIATAGSVTIEDAAQVTFSTPGDDLIEVMLVDSGGLSAALPDTVTVSATAEAISGDTTATPKTVSVGSSGQELYGVFGEAQSNKTFNVDFTLTTTGAATGTSSYFIQYTMYED
jgi:hypothetical protein